MKQLCKKAINEEVKEDEVSFNRSFNVRKYNGYFSNVQGV